MALITCDFYAETLGLNVSMNVILPQRTLGQYGMTDQAAPGRHPTLWLLHGLSDDHTIWSRRTSIERYVAGRGIAVVMPAVHRSFYADMMQGLRYWTFVSEELPELARSFFPLSDRREDNFVAGLSMGGYGAFKLALSHPERYAAAASLSGALDMHDLMRRPDRNRVDEWTWTFGDPAAFAGSSNDLLHLAAELAGSERPRPALYVRCGTADFLHDDNVKFHKHLDQLQVDHHYEQDPGEEHEWGYWDATIQHVLDWLDEVRGVRKA